ncbi:glutamate-5-semialdehyde dehydrogenase [Actinomyces sp. zg-332]|nr:glutamate-5-semialdehyde dehydrogenase [Actinomyces sp. zg-332]QPK94459.1 glutamate-5-semialdehyde dehydrogenase [Actinomyces sp. zg-332]
MNTTVSDMSAEEFLISHKKTLKIGAKFLKNATREIKDSALHNIAKELEFRASEIVEENKKDLAKARENNLSEGIIDRLLLDEERVKNIANSVREIASFPDPVGNIVSGTKMPNGLKVTSITVPLGVVGIIYEARPNVTVDTACLGIKSGNAVILRGGSAALHTNAKIVEIMNNALVQSGMPTGLICSVDEFGRAGAKAMMTARGIIDVLIPRGGADLISTVVENSTVPVIETGTGNCHIYVDKSADIDKAINILLNSKTQRVGVCNAAETLLVHKDIKDIFLQRALQELSDKNVIVHGCEKTKDIADKIENLKFELATLQDWEKEYLSHDIACKIVESIDEAIEHINEYSSKHTEAICAYDLQAVDKFKEEIDSATIAVNASTRFTDGGQFGLGAEVGISTQKLHARGPMGLSSLTTISWYVEGDGTIRK